MNTAGSIIMKDSAFNRASPVPIFGKPFAYENPINIDDLPKVNAVIISHDHYDHLNFKAIKDLSKFVDRFFVPLGVKSHLKRGGGLMQIESASLIGMKVRTKKMLNSP